MKFTLNNFYSNNYKDFIHLEALKNILRKVPELNLAGLENIENVLSMEFSVDDWGENPMYIKYFDTDGKEHIVKIRPAVTEQIYEILKPYAKISYVDEQDKKLKDELHTEITQGDENTLNGSKEYTDTVVNSAKDELRTEITQGDESTLNGSKKYTDTVVNSAKDELHTEITQGDESTLNGSKEYTDTKAHELSQRIDDCTTSLNGKIETTNQQVTSNKEAIANNSNRIDTANQLITANDNKTTQALADVNTKIEGLSVGGRNYLLGTADFTWPTGIGDWNNPKKTIEQYNSYLKMVHVSNSALGGIYTKWAGAFPNGELQIGENYTFSFDAKGTGTFLSVGNESDKQITKTSVDAAFLTVGNESDKQATKTYVVGTALTPSWKRYSVSGTITTLNKAFVIYFKPNYDVYIKCVKIEKGNMATDWTPAPEDTIDELSSINGKIKATNQQVASNKEAIANNSNRIDTANQLITANDNKTTQALADVNTRIDNIPRATEVTRTGGIFKERLNIETDNPNDFYSTVILEQRDGTEGEVVGRLVKGDVAKKSDLDALNGDVNGKIEATNQQVASNKEAINAIKQNMFNVAYGKKINGTLQNGWHMKQEKDREFAILWDWNNSDDHSQGARWIINMNYIYKSNATASDIANFSLIGTVDIPSEVLQQFPNIGDTWVYSGYALQSWRIVSVPFFKFERHENQYQVKIVNTPRTGVLEGDIGEVQINAGGTSPNYWLKTAVPQKYWR